MYKENFWTVKKQRKWQLGHYEQTDEDEEIKNNFLFLYKMSKSFIHTKLYYVFVNFLI